MARSKSTGRGGPFRMLERVGVEHQVVHSKLAVGDAGPAHGGQLAPHVIEGGL